MEREPRTVYLLRQTQLRAFAMLERALEPHGLTPTQYTVLSLADRPAPHLSSAQLARRAGVKAQTMNEAISALFCKGLVDKVGSTTNRRIIWISASIAGQALLQKCTGAVDALEDDLFSALYENERIMLRNMLRRTLSDEGVAS